jgi:hypothetical protein
MKSALYMYWKGNLVEQLYFVKKCGSVEEKAAT